MVLPIIIIILFVLFPVLGLPIYLFFYITDKKKPSWFYPVILGVSIGIVSYYFVPKLGYDLIKHQAIVQLFQAVSFKEFLGYTKTLDLEFLPLLYSYIISFFDKIDLLQFFVVASGYSIMFYILYDYRKEQTVSLLGFVALTIFTIFGFNTLYFISGLYCYIGIILFSLALYLEYIKNSKKIIPYSLYVICLFVHNSLFLPVLLLIIYKLFGKKLNFRTIILCIVIFVFSLDIISILNSIFPNIVFKNLIDMYNNYVTRNEHYKIYYSGTIFFIEISKLLISLLFTILDKSNNKDNNTVHNYIFLLSFSTILMMLKTRVAIRYIMIVQIISIVPIMNVLNKSKSKTNLLLIGILAFFGLFYLAYFLTVFSNQSFGTFFDNKFYNTIFTIFNK